MMIRKHIPEFSSVPLIASKERGKSIFLETRSIIAKNNYSEGGELNVV